VGQPLEHASPLRDKCHPQKTMGEKDENKREKNEKTVLSLW
jgi:hypothetical protein